MSGVLFCSSQDPLTQAMCCTIPELSIHSFPVGLGGCAVAFNTQGSWLVVLYLA